MRSYLVNAVDTALAEPVSGADATIRVTDPTGLPPTPFYLVVDPFSDVAREYMLANAVNDDVLTVTRNLAGTESTNHDAGDIVRITYMAQHLDDLWDEAESHLPLAGGTMAGDLDMAQNFLYGLANPTNPDDATHKAYVDGLVDAIPPQTYLHDDLTDVTADQHHVRYSDDEARSAIDGIYLPLTGGSLTGDLTIYGHLTAWIPPGSGNIAGVTADGLLVDLGTTWRGPYLELSGGTLTGAILGITGGVTGPSFSFSAYPNSGMYQVNGKVRIASEGAFQAEFNGGGVKAGSGSAADPSIGFLTDGDLGMYREGTLLGFAHGGVNRMTIGSADINMNRIVRINSNLYLDPISTSGNQPNVYIATDGRLFKSTAITATQETVDTLQDQVDALEARIATLEA